jgi:predicted nucleic acid-binding protein
MSIISNTTVLSNFAAINQLPLLQQLHPRLYVPTAVYDEIRRGLDEGYAFSQSILNQIYPFHDHGWIHLTSATGENELRYLGQLPPKIHAGEAECLAIAKERGWLLLTDDRAARKIARAEHIALSGTLGCLVLMVEQMICPLPGANHHLSEMIHQGYRSPITDLTTLLA